MVYGAVHSKTIKLWSEEERKKSPRQLAEDCEGRSCALELKFTFGWIAQCLRRVPEQSKQNLDS